MYIKTANTFGAQSQKIFLEILGVVLPSDRVFEDMDSLVQCEVSIQRVVNSHLDKDVVLSVADRSAYRKHNAPTWHSHTEPLEHTGTLQMLLWNFVVKILTSSHEDVEELLLAARFRCGRSCCVAMREMMSDCGDDNDDVSKRLDTFCMEAMLHIRAGRHRDCNDILNKIQQVVLEADSYSNYCSLRFLCALHDIKKNVTDAKDELSALTFLKTLLSCDDKRDMSQRLVALARCAIDLNQYESALFCCEQVLSNESNEDSIKARSNVSSIPFRVLTHSLYHIITVRNSHKP